MLENVILQIMNLANIRNILTLCGGVIGWFQQQKRVLSIRSRAPPRLPRPRYLLRRACLIGLSRTLPGIVRNVKTRSDGISRFPMQLRFINQ